MAFFISHSHKDTDFIDDLERQMDDAGLAYWTDKHIKPGAEWRKAIDNALKDCSGVIAVISVDSAQSQYVTYEWAFAMGLGKPVIQLLLNDPGSFLHPKLEPEQHIKKSDPDFWQKLINHLMELSGQHRKIPSEIVSAKQALDHHALSERLSAIKTLEDTDDPEAVEALAEAVQHNIRDVSIEAAFALCRKTNYQDHRAIPGLDKALKYLVEKKPGAYLESQQKQALMYLGQIGGERVVQVIKSFLESYKQDDRYVRTTAISALGNANDKSAIPILLDQLKDKDDLEVVSSAAHALRTLRADTPEVIDGLMNIVMNTTYEPTRIAAAKSLAKINPDETLNLFRNLLPHTTEPTFIKTIKAMALGLGEIKDSRSIQLLQLIKDTSPYSEVHEIINTVISELQKIVK